MSPSRRKKDHGRAEALLLAAWASGIPLPEEAFQKAFGLADQDAATEAVPNGTNDDLLAIPVLQEAQS